MPANSTPARSSPATHATAQQQPTQLSEPRGRTASIDGNIALPEQTISSSPDDLINAIYPDIGTVPPPPPEYFLNRMILAPHNHDVSKLNNLILGQMSGDEKTYFSADKILHEAGAEAPNEDFEDLIPVEFLRAINDADLPPSELTLKIGCPLILLRDLIPNQGLSNGSKMVVLHMGERVLEVRLVGGDHDGEIALIPRIPLTSSSSSRHGFRFSRRQFPVRLAFALTIDEAQGQSVNM